MSMPGDTIRHIFSLEGGGKGRQAYAICNETSACHFTARSLGILSAFYLILMALASGVAVPGGLFMPSIMVGLGPTPQPPCSFPLLHLLKPKGGLGLATSGFVFMPCGVFLFLLFFLSTYGHVILEGEVQEVQTAYI